MKAFTKLSLFVLTVIATLFVLRNGDRAMHASVPRDMPSDSHFIPTGFDVNHSEAKGQWVACRADAAEQTDWCRVTDARGTVVYQGGFVPVSTPQPLPDSELRVASNTSGHLWVQGPAEASPVPVIPLASGQLLVPVQDREALHDRWAANPDELRQIQGL
jgi:hypothetical protein